MQMKMPLVECALNLRQDVAYIEHMVSFLACADGIAKIATMLSQRHAACYRVMKHCL